MFLEILHTICIHIASVLLFILPLAVDFAFAKGGGGGGRGGGSSGGSSGRGSSGSRGSTPSPGSSAANPRFINNQPYYRSGGGYFYGGVFFVYGTGPLGGTADGKPVENACGPLCIGLIIGGFILFTLCAISLILIGIRIRKKDKRMKEKSSAEEPPSYSAVTQAEPAHLLPKYNDAPVASYNAALAFVQRNPIAPPPPEPTIPPWTSFTFAQNIPPEVLAGMGVNTSPEGNVIFFSNKKDTCIQSMFSIPLYGPPDSVYYYEIKIKSKAKKTVIAIGLSTRPYPSFRLPGWEPISVGYHSDDGRKFINDAMGGRDYAKPFKDGDVIGVGYRPSDGLVFFAKNGSDLGVAGVGVGIGQGMYPTIGADGKAELVADFTGMQFHRVNTL